VARPGVGPEARVHDWGSSRGHGMRIVYPADQEIPMLLILSNPRFWDMKVRIAILTLATFIAMC
jgi:hypothetical protein